MLLESELPTLLGELSAGLSPRADFVAGAHRRHRRRQLVRGASAVAVVALLATGTTVGLAHHSSKPGVLSPADSPSTAPPAVAAGDAYSSVEQGTHDLILISADTGVHTVLHHTAPGDPVPVTAVVSPSRRYVYYLTMDPTASRSASAWRIPIDGGDPQKLPSGPHAGPDGAGGLGISPADLVVSPDDTEYAYPDFAERVGVFIQQVSGGAPVEALDGDQNLATATPIGWRDDAVLLLLGTGSKPTDGAFIFAGEGQGNGQVLDSAPNAKGSPCGAQASGAAAMLADRRVVYAADPCGPTTAPGLRVVDPTNALSQAGQIPAATTWTAPAALDGFSVVDVTPLPDGRALVRYDDNCGAKPLPTLIWSADGTSEPAYGLPVSSLHC